MEIKVGAKVSGKVTGITSFGAFVTLADGKTGLVHISEISDKFIKDIHGVLKIGDTVTVKVLKIGDDGKISLSMKRALPESERKEYFKKRREHNHERHEHGEHGEHGHGHFHHGHNEHGYNYGHGRYHGHNNYHRKRSFNDLMSKFLKQSQSRLSVIRKNTEGKRGGRGGRRS
ncbi:S1 domain-containing RNA-binding protein [Acetilactobacillus jinshanensis]|uniref:RNA-binding protein S1 n=1 Tax=Acetilactobacillus jinshanensis TaxID=1720083 RepID=A0A4P6ZMC0_9LACO|nr:S1 domain-containing RNA-binding protein [Acetilactobacillus jinshanensis]QBP18868.1 RNA-binding protein S1 [Acetilactobacillus jinshanensis]URL60581.1 RNA-binding protein S1 [uncultured bacterium]